VFRKKLKALRVRLFGKSLKEMGIEIIRDQRGQSTTEYILILAIVVMIAMKFKDKFSTSIEKLTDKVTDEIERGISNDSYQ